MNGKQLREERRQRGLTQAQLAEAAGVVKGTISNWEIGRFEPEPATIKKVALALREYPIVFDFTESGADADKQATPAA